MIKNYLKVAIRNLLKHKGYAFINILGLAVGIAASVLIFLYITHEISYDTFHKRADRIYRITADWSNQGDSRIHQLGTPYILAQTIREKYPQVESITQLSGPLNRIFVFENSFRRKIIVRYWGAQKTTHQGKMVMPGLSLAIFAATFSQDSGLIESRRGWASASLSGLLLLSLSVFPGYRNRGYCLLKE